MRLLNLLFFLLPIAVTAQSTFVSKIVDGDTFKDSTGLSYRLIGINAPETNEIGGHEATIFLDGLINHKFVQIVMDNNYDTIDFYKRKLCYVFIDGTDINKLMVQTGHAITYTKYPFAKMQEYLTAQKEFMSNSPAVQQTATTSKPSNDKFLTRKNIKAFLLFILVIGLMAVAFYYYYRK
jgi:endonuclease YncB( thermonuclease family)